MIFEVICFQWDEEPHRSEARSDVGWYKIYGVADSAQKLLRTSKIIGIIAESVLRPCDSRATMTMAQNPLKYFFSWSKDGLSDLDQAQFFRVGWMRVEEGLIKKQHLFVMFKRILTWFLHHRQINFQVQIRILVMFWDRLFCYSSIADQRQAHE